DMVARTDGQGEVDGRGRVHFIPGVVLGVAVDKVGVGTDLLDRGRAPAVDADPGGGVAGDVAGDGRHVPLTVDVADATGVRVYGVGGPVGARGVSRRGEPPFQLFDAQANAIPRFHGRVLNSSGDALSDETDNFRALIPGSDCGDREPSSSSANR